MPGETFFPGKPLHFYLSFYPLKPLSVTLCTHRFLALFIFVKKRNMVDSLLLQVVVTIKACMIHFAIILLYEMSLGGQLYFFRSVSKNYRKKRIS
ncbi:hypothetical protein A8F95_10925 [Bacillus wudalianchiensis]|uniref:Uncharacterized protein n=1 Tax=Pseudobacillus wudalianchiensis TaxID=1743143 RepID=A0A1B9AMY4_9BACI|nr:hypothetical protein A8F95_10925 [Bacillus wudalianchiensis]